MESRGIKDQGWTEQEGVFREDTVLEKTVIGPAELYCADCFEVLPLLSGIDLVLTDMPYNSTPNAWDRLPDLPRLWRGIERAVCKHAAILLFCDMRLAVRLIKSNEPLYRYDLVWEKGMAVGFLDANRRPLRKHEFILCFSQGQSKYYPQKSEGKPWKIKSSGKASNYKQERIPGKSDGGRYPVSVLSFGTDKEKYHPTQKPVPLLTYLIKNYSQGTETVLDCFMGSGSTGVAAIKSGRRFVGIEKERKFFDIACQRMEKALQESSLTRMVESKSQQLALL